MPELESGRRQGSARSGSGMSAFGASGRVCRQVLAVVLGVSLGVGIGGTISAWSSPTPAQQAEEASLELQEQLHVKLAQALERAAAEEKKALAAEVLAESKAKGVIEMMGQAKARERSLQAGVEAAREATEATEKDLREAEAKIRKLTKAKDSKAQAALIAGWGRVDKGFTASLDCALMGGIDCSSHLSSWADGACVASVPTDNATCKEYCEERGMNCVKAAAGSAADADSDPTRACSVSETSSSKKTDACTVRRTSSMNSICACVEAGGAGLSVPFYLYDDPVMRMSDLKESCPSWGKRDADVEFIEQAASHPLRTRSHKKAKLFLVTIPIVTSFSCGKNHTNRTIEALQRLVDSPTWKSTRGRQHVWMLFDWRIMRWADSAWNLIPDDPERGEWSNHVRLLENMTVLTYENWQTHPRTCKTFSKQFHGYCHPKDFSWLPFEMWACSVVVPYFAAEGIGAKDVADLFPTDTFAEWMARETMLFYRNDPNKDYQWGATAVRRLPLNLTGLPNVSVGGNIPKVAHIRAMSEAKFCLVTRGDTPSSHKLFDAVRALCIPVIISDLWHRVAKPFPTLLAWDTFSLSIPEPYFIKEPWRAIAFLWTLSVGELRRLYRGLFAARLALDWRAPGSRTTSFVLASAVDTCVPARA